MKLLTVFCVRHRRVWNEPLWSAVHE